MYDATTDSENEEEMTRIRRTPKRRTTSIIKVISLCVSLELEEKNMVFEELGMTDPMRLSETNPKAYEYVKKLEFERPLE